MTGGLLCLLGFVRHTPVRVSVGGGFAYRCARCGHGAPTVLELLDPLDEDGRVRVRYAVHGTRERYD